MRVKPDSPTRSQQNMASAADRLTPIGQNNGAARGQRRWTPGATIRVLLTKREAAQALGMSVRHFERHVQRRLRCVHSGQLTLYPLRDIERWADEEATLGGRGRKRVR
jgi:hypothetical protein